MKSDYWSPSGESLSLGEFNGRSLYATEVPSGRVEFVAVSDHGCAKASESPPSLPQSLEEEAAWQAEVSVELGVTDPFDPSPVEECKRRWWALQSEERVEAARRWGVARREEAENWKAHNAALRALRTLGEVGEA